MSYTYKIKLMTSVKHEKRGIAFLISNDPRITAWDTFNKLGDCEKNFFRTRFDTWHDRMPYKKAYHGWDQSEQRGKYIKCFVFKHQSDRFYGFLCNPKKLEPFYLVCVLVRHAFKNQWETDFSELDIVEEIRNMSVIHDEINNFFGEKNAKTLDRKKY